MRQVGRVGRIGAAVTALMLLVPHLRADADRDKVYAVRLATVVWKDLA